MAYKLWITGPLDAWRDGRSDGGREPGPGDQIAEVVNGGRADVDAAVQEGSSDAFYDGRWSRLTPSGAARLDGELETCRDLLEANADKFRAGKSENTGQAVQFR